MNRMVGYKVSQSLLSYTVVRPVDDLGSGDLLFNRTVKNLNKMIEEGRPCKVVSPDRPLDKKEIEQYRRYFCKKAKEHKVNYVYFTVPVRLFRRSEDG